MGMDLAVKTNLESEEIDSLSVRLYDKPIQFMLSQDWREASVILSFALIAGRFYKFVRVWRRGAPGAWNKSHRPAHVCAEIVIQLYQ